MTDQFPGVGSVTTTTLHARCLPTFLAMCRTVHPSGSALPLGATTHCSLAQCRTSSPQVQWLTKINLQLETAAGQLNDARKAAAEWQERFMRERNVRRRLHDQLQQLKGNIRVMCRWGRGAHGAGAGGWGRSRADGAGRCCFRTGEQGRLSAVRYLVVRASPR